MTGIQHLNPQDDEDKKIEELVQTAESNTATADDRLSAFLDLYDMGALNQMLNRNAVMWDLIAILAKKHLGRE